MGTVGSRMRAVARWRGGVQTDLDDGRGHSVVVDLPKHEGGADLGPSALELNVLSFAGCISTVFALVARKRRLRYDAMTVELEALRPDGAATISRVEGTVRVVASSAPDDVETAVRIALKTCPIGVLYERAHIPVRVRTVVSSPPKLAAPLHG